MDTLWKELDSKKPSVPHMRSNRQCKIGAEFDLLIERLLEIIDNKFDRFLLLCQYLLRVLLPLFLIL